MECIWDSALLQGDGQLPDELLQIIQEGTNEQYLEALTRTALDARYTYILLAHCEDLLAHVCASLRSCGSFAVCIGTLGRIVPFAPFLAPYATGLFGQEQYHLGTSADDNEDLLYLLGLFRLLRFNHRIFRRHVRAAELTLMLGRRSRPVTYLILRILQIHLQGADHWFESCFEKYLGKDSPESSIIGTWDEKTIDYRFLSLWEEDRAESVARLIQSAKRTSNAITLPVRTIPVSCFRSSTVLIGGVLLPSATALQAQDSANVLVETETIATNLKAVSQTLKSSAPILLSGLPGSGKSLLVRHVAGALGHLNTMVTLHLNEQSDAKLLLGLYTTGSSPGTFEWRPGVLATAVREGRWVLIEDLDRAPNEVLGTLLPLIEKGELFIPNRKDIIHATEGFRIIATVRSSMNHQGEESKPLTHMIGYRHWQILSLRMPLNGEQAQIAQRLFPNLEKLLSQFLAVYDRLTKGRQQSKLAGQSKTGVARSITPRELLKWCQRVSGLIQNRDTFNSSDMDNIYLEAVDCFLGSLPDDDLRSNLAALVAEEMRIDPQRRDYLANKRDVQYKNDGQNITIGRYSLRKARNMKKPDISFSTNPHTSRILERVAAAVSNREPLLLVGETGVGKTTAVQHLANHLGRKLVPFNLSQQSEAGDLLGGFKPVNARMLTVPMKDEFDELFSESFSASKNRQFTDLLGRQMARSNWKAVCKLWRQALVMVEQQRASSPTREGEAPSKKRRVDNKRVVDFSKWDAFTSKLESLERQLSGGDNVFAFTFVEGNIVKAVRNGDWVLLDEINLASPDTLEALADLLDPDCPSLLLTEAGDIERIDAHPDFRVFAAMNPATDVGKKDLPPGIRSRFTEIFVDGPDKDFKSLCSIVSAYLRQESAADPALPPDVSTLYQKIISLSEDNKLVDGAGQKPHFSLRTMTRTLSYAKNIQQMCSPRRALYEGFHMSFLTFLDAESSSLLQPLFEQHLFGKRINVRAELNKALRKPQDGRPYVQGFPDSKDNRYASTKHWIRQGSEERQEQPHYIITPFVRNNLENLVRATSTRQFPVLIQGPTSSGKTSMIEYLAKRTGHKFTRINNHEHTDLQEYLGTYVSGTDGRLQFQEGVLVKALREGHWIVLDELNLAPTDVLEALNRLLDDNRELLVPETQEVIRPHPDFMLFATQNPAGLYGGRKTLSRAFRNRFLELHFDDIPVHELEDILHRRTRLPKTWVKRILSVYRELSILRQDSRVFEQKSFATLRDLFRWAMRPNETVDQLAANGYMLLCERVRKPEDREALKAILEKVMSEKGPKVRVDEEILYSEESPEVQQYYQHSTRKGVVWTRAMRRLYVLVSRAIQNNEPVLLVGQTGCGKTTVCQMLADALQKDLHIVNAHQNTETGDLIGSQRPVRNRAGIETTLRQKLLSSAVLQFLDEQSSTDELLTAYDQALAAAGDDDKAACIQSAVYADIQALRTSFKALFEWNDGSLVHAMRNGDFFLLDEISLADDSVLERINSVLESQRTILLAEKGSLDSSVTAADGFQFFATMNPGGDYGKRELSPALRNRFTEIWVPALSDLEDVLHIVRDKLTQSAQPYADAMVKFAAWFRSRFDNSASSSVSIRDTLAWVQFVNAFSALDIKSAVVHGAAMVYIDTLGANPAGLMSVVSQNIAEERAACLQELGTLLTVDASAVYGQSLSLSRDDSRFGIGPFKVNRVPSSTENDLGFSFDPPTTRSNAMRVLRALQLSKPVMLEGSPGVGKTALVTAIAGAVGMPLTRINLSDQTDLLDLFGSDAPVEGAQTGTFKWRDAPFLRAMKDGEWVLLDEMNLAAQSVLEGLNACLDHRESVFVPELGQTFTRHPNFRLFAAQNPHHQGGGRKGLPASFVNRFTVVYADSFKAEDIKLICQCMFPTLDPSKTEQAVAFVSKLDDEVAHRRKFGVNGGPWEFNLRDIARWLALATSDTGLLKSGTPRDFVDSMFKQRFRTTHDRACVDDLFASVFGSNVPTADLFSSISAHTLQVGLGLLPRDAVTAAPRQMHTNSNSQQRITQSVMVCIQQGWPVILTGSSGSGKTVLLERLSTTVGAELVTLAMSSETDALDLIGGLEQFDPHRETAQALKDLKLRCDQLAKHGLLVGSDDRVAELLRYVEGLETSLDPDALSKLAQIIPAGVQADFLSLLKRLQHGRATIDKARFNWIDGPLVESLRQGKWLVLDNANLCSASVLDRINSLLEPNGALIINEHSAPDGSPKILRPHPRFRIFLTADPRFGELSRAMRNRAVELFMMPDDNVASSTDGLYAESAMARFRALKMSAEKMQPQNTDVMFDHLSHSDKNLITRLHDQLGSGLFGSAMSVIPVQESLTSPTTTASSLQTFYEQTSSHMQVPADFACVQTFHPLNNQPLVQRFEQAFQQALSLGAQYDLQISSRAVAHALATIKASRKQSARLSRAWKSIRQEIGVAGNRNMTPLDLVQGLLHSIQTGLQQGLADSPEHLLRFKRSIHLLLAYCTTLLEVLAAESLDAGTLTACTLAGHAMCGAESLASAPSLNTVFAQFGQSLAAFDPQASRGFGQTHVVLWQAFRPDVPTTMDGLQAVLAFENVVDRFDLATASFQLPTDQVVNLRMAFQQVLKLGTSAGSRMIDLAKQAQASMPVASTNEDDDKTSVVVRPHFATSFETLCQHFTTLALTDINLQSYQGTLLETLAMRKTIASIYPTDSQQSPHSRLRLLKSSLSHTEPQSETAYRSVPDTILHNLAAVEQVSLRDMSLLDAETRALGHVIGGKAHLIQADCLPVLNTALRGLLHSVLTSLAEQDPESQYASQFLIALNDSSAIVPTGSEGFVAQSLKLVVEYVRFSEGLTRQGASKAWMTFAVACILLFVPERAFDPVQEAQLRKSIHENAKGGLQLRLEALTSFRHAWFGQPESLRARLLQDDIAGFGPGPDVVEICRPPTSQLTELYSEFSGLTRLLQPVLKSGRQGISPEILDAHAFENLKVLRSRLESRQYRPYADLTIPVVGFINCLLIAQRLHQQSVAGLDKESDDISLAKIVPLVKASPESWTNESLLSQVQHCCRSREEQLYWLSAIAVRSHAFPATSLSSELQTAIDESFRTFYEAWKIELSRDQKLNAAKSSLYKYRGGDALEEEGTQEELDEIFPTFESANEDMAAASRMATSAQSLSLRMAELFHAIYASSKPTDAGLMALLEQWASFSITSAVDQSAFAPLLCGISNLTTTLQPDSKARSINIYQHAQINQNRALITLVHKVQSRFRTIHAVWPDHATPIEVLRACDQALAISHTEPLARLFPPVEKLHATINEWQKIASSEFSASSLLDEMTDIIICWRRLELSTWAGMFDSEDEKCAQDASSWWYIAYETIIRASHESTADPNVAQKFAHHLLDTLSSFLTTCGLGEYKVRLSMLRDFEVALAVRSSQEPGISIICQALSSLISFYTRFESAIADQLTKKRQHLENDIKNVIQFASWKDRNIETLRQSAKNSHKKLFRTVRKYRQVLSESVAPILQAEFPYVKIEGSTVDKDIWQIIVNSVGEQDSSDLSSSAQLAVLRSPLVAIRVMKEKTDTLRKSSAAVTRIEKYLQELDEETVELRKATPSILTEENKTLVQHLKARKRRLLADVLRDVRLMGFQTNISDNVLAQQQSLAIVLAKTSDLSKHTGYTGLEAADQEFHRLLHIMPTVRTSAVKHSEDLTPAEVARSKILIESMLQVSIDQRQVLAQQWTHLQDVQSSVSQVEALAASEKVTLLDQVEKPQLVLTAQIVTFLGVLTCSSRCVGMQGKLCGNDFSHVVSALDNEVQQLEALRTETMSQRDLPSYISNANVARHQALFDDSKRTIRTTCFEAVITLPELRPLLSQLLAWTQETSLIVRASNGRSESILTAEQWLSSLTTLTMSACEFPIVNEQSKTDGQAKKMWLLERQKTLCSSVDSLRLASNSCDLRALLNNLHRVQFDPLNGLTQVVTACQRALPLMRAYSTVAEQILHELSSLHASTSKMAHRLATSFVQLANQGFCTPPDKGQNDEQKSGNVESGTGLGEGEGAEDISKDIGDDEDLGELAQDANSKDQKDETEAEKDAVDMADEDLEGNFDEDAGSEGDDEDQGDEGQSDADVDEEAGHVDADDAEAKDEKTWNDQDQVGEADKEAESMKGTKSDDVSAATDNAKEGMEEENGEEVEGPDDEAEAGAEVDHHEPDRADTHMNEEENLDLPDDINMDGEKDVNDEMSIADSDLGDDFEDVDTNEQNVTTAEDKDVEMGEEDTEDPSEPNGEASMQDEEQEKQEQGEDINLDTAMLDQREPENEPAEGLVSADGGQGQEQDDRAQENGALDGDDQLENENDMHDPSTQSGTAKGGNRSQQDTSSGQAEIGDEDKQTQPYKQLGDVLKEWYKQNRDIEAAKEPEGTPKETEEELNMDDPRFEHTDDAEVDMQALGAAKAEQSRALNDENAKRIEQVEDELEAAPKLDDEDEEMLEQLDDAEGEGTGQTGSNIDPVADNSKAMIGRPTNGELDMTNAMEPPEEEDMDDMDEQLTNTHLSHDEKSLMPIEEARQAWSEHEGRTRNMAVVLTEHLRLILQPTQATKMRGDFRTGKRLNIKKIIPYIASSYKRDKIWMRRSIPSKRSYQIMLAIDDSESMNESERKGLAFDTLALVAKSMAMLEVGELCIVGFGETVNINHDFSMPFTSETGAEVFRHFSFAQSKTNVGRLLEQSIELFRAARLRATGSGSNLWQLQLIISDGLCEDHPSIRQLVRRAHEEQVMVVFIVVDAAAQQTGPKQSITDLQRAEFSGGDVKMIKYLDTFPFRYYLIVRDVLELPAVLAGALRQWFSEVMESGS